MTQPTPTPAAMRAAKAILNLPSGSFTPTRIMAEVIDREIGLPELIALAREVAESETGFLQHEALAALAKAGAK